MTSDKNNPDDYDLFRKTIGTIQPLKTEPRHFHKKPLSSKLPAQTPATSALGINIYENNWDTLEEMPELHLLDDTISRVFIRPGVQHRTMKQLRRGKIAVDDTLDLHGATAVQATQHVRHFILTSIANRFRAVMIIHGKGLRSTNNAPVLKTRVNYWLRDNENVMGFCPAAPHHGGSGALYVLLKLETISKSPQNM
jgi:DNA-nicking Smr family endonuclease